jgi:hypothetical protein
MEHIPQAEHQLSFFYNLRPFKTRNRFSPFGSQGNYKDLDREQVHKGLKLDVWNVCSCMFSVFIESWPKKKKLLMFLNFCHYMQFLGTYSGLYILIQPYLSAWFTILQCIQLLLWKIFQSLCSYSSDCTYLLEDSVCGMFVKEIQIRWYVRLLSNG